MKVNIIIKSFNRPYYLDRCLQSIDKNVHGNFQITVVDDGTPQKYLDKIKQKYPKVEIHTSENHSIKSEKIEKGDEINGFEIPSNLWKKAVQDSQDYVLVTEDDVWFTKPIDLEAIVKEMSQNNIQLTKLGWLGMAKQDFVSENDLTENLVSTYPNNLITSSEIFMDLFFYNKFKTFSLMYKLGFVDNHTLGKYWSLNSILMGLYHKDYWLHIWKDSNNNVDEIQQLRNAATYFHRNKKNRNLIARTSEEVMNTTFSSSATNSYHKYQIEIDMNKVNQILNQAWFNGQFDAMENYPKDFSEAYILQFLDGKVNTAHWKMWVEKFKAQYRNQGANVD